MRELAAYKLPFVNSNPLHLRLARFITIGVKVRNTSIMSTPDDEHMQMFPSAYSSQTSPTPLLWLFPGRNFYLAPGPFWSILMVAYIPPLLPFLLHSLLPLTGVNCYLTGRWVRGQEAHAPPLAATPTQHMGRPHRSGHQCPSPPVPRPITYAANGAGSAPIQACPTHFQQKG